MDRKTSKEDLPHKDQSEIEAEAEKFWDEIAATSERSAKVVKILRDYREVMKKAGPPYRYG